MPHKRDKGKVSIYSEVGLLIHQHLRRIKKQYRLPIYRIIELAIIFALSDLHFEPYLKRMSTPEVHTMDLP